MLTIFYVTLLVITTIIWGYIFYKRDYHPQPWKVVKHSFMIGLFAMVPIFAYKHIYKNFLPTLSEYEIFRPLVESPFMIGISVFMLNLVILSLLLFGLSGAISLIVNKLNYSVLINLKNAIKNEPLGFTAVSILLGLVVYFQTLTQNTFVMPVVGGIIGSILFLAVIEEYIKHLMVRITDDKKIKDIDDAITLSIVVGLAFAFIEIIIYCLFTGNIDILFYRSLISMPIHLVASGIFGYFYGLAHFAKPIVKLEEGGEKTYRSKWLPKFLSLKRSTLYHEEKIIEGTFFATLFHAAMNLFFEFNLGFLAIPCIVLGIILIFRMYKMGQSENRLLNRLKRKGLGRA